VIEFYSVSSGFISSFEDVVFLLLNKQGFIQEEKMELYAYQVRRLFPALGLHNRSVDLRRAYEFAELCIPQIDTRMLYLTLYYYATNVKPSILTDASMASAQPPHTLCFWPMSVFPKRTTWAFHLI
jgi:hypothetical protein